MLDKKRVFFIVILIILLALTLYLIRPFIGALFLGGLIAYLLFPIYKKLVVKLKHKYVAQSLLGAATLLVLLLLVGLIVIPLTAQAGTIYEQSEYYVSNYVEDFKKCSTEDVDSVTCRVMRTAGKYFTSEDFKVKSKEVIEKTSLFFYESVGSIITGVASLTFFLFVMVFSIFYFLNHGKEIKDAAMDLVPLSRSNKSKMSKRLKDTINAVLIGNIGTALLQGVAGGFIFFLLGIPASIFLGLLMAILAFIPLVGASFIWIPAAIILIIKGSYIKALILAVYCILIIGSIESILKPKWIGKKIQLPAFIIFLGVVGGLKVFGLLGLFFGPLIIALLVTSLEIYRGMNGDKE